AVSAHQLVHRVQAGKRIPRIKEPAFVERFEIVFDITPRQGCAAEYNRNGNPPLVHQLEVLSHDERRLNQQSAHADSVGAMLFKRLENVVNRLLDAKINDLVAVVGQDDIDQILTDVVYVALDRSQNHSAFGGCAALLFNEGLEEAHRGLHRFSRLQHK